MPARAKLEGLVAGILGPLPSFQDERFIEQLLQHAAEEDEVSMIGLVAVALGAECYPIDLKHQIIVDTRLEFIYFCAAQRYSPSKVVHLNKWLVHFRRMVEDGRGSDELRVELLSFVASEIEASWKWKQMPPAEEGCADSQIPSKGAGKKGARVSERVVVEEAEVAAAIPKENIYLTKEDVGPFSTWLLDGIIRHASLYMYVAGHKREIGAPEEFVSSLDIPMPAPPLQFASVVEKAPQKPSPSLPTAALENMRQQRATEVAVLVNEYEEAKAKEALWRTTKQTEKEMQFLIENEGAKKAAEDTYEGLQHDLGQRQGRILQRIAALERILGVGPFSSNASNGHGMSAPAVV